MKRRPDEQIIYSLFDDPKEVEASLDQLLAAGISVEDVSILVHEDTHDRDFRPLLHTKAKKGAAAGGVAGGALGGILGGLAVLGAVTGGTGLLVLGPALAMAAAGSLLGGLIGFGIPDEEAKRLRDAVHAGSTLMAVHVHEPTKVKAARRILKQHQGDDNIPLSA